MDAAKRELSEECGFGASRQVFIYTQISYTSLINSLTQVAYTSFISRFHTQVAYTLEKKGAKRGVWVQCLQASLHIHTHFIHKSHKFTHTSCIHKFHTQVPYTSCIHIRKKRELKECGFGASRQVSIHSSFIHKSHTHVSCKSHSQVSYTLPFCVPYMTNVPFFLPFFLCTHTHTHIYLSLIHI